MIPVEAVEAAATAMREKFWSGDGDFESQARAALEAAAPHLLAQGWDEGVRESETGQSVIVNPYRPAR